MSFLVTYPSAGHHLKDSGASYNGRFENKETIAFRNALVKELVNYRVSVITDRDTEINREYQNRIKPAAGSVVLDIHFNAGSVAASGTECYVSANASSESVAFATEICKTASVIIGIPNRGVKKENQSQHSKIGILHTKAGIAVLWEICFISNPSDMAKYDQNFCRLVKGIAELCKKYDDLK